MAEKLEPCPFCGEVEASHARAAGFDYIWCEGCGAEGPAAELRAEAIRLWNTRKQKEPTK